MALTGDAVSTAAKAKYLNEKFHPHMRVIGAPNASSRNVFRGWLMTDATRNSGVTGKVRFMYNPPDITVGHTANMAIPTGSAIDKSTLGSAAGQYGELSLLLRFDRTYELWDPEYKNTAASREGVGHDVGCIYQMLGIAPAGSSDPSLPMALTPMYVVLGASTARAQGPVAPGASVPTIGKYLSYYGVVNSFNVHYTSFTRSMVPRRAEVSLQLTLTTPSDVGLLGEAKAATTGFSTQDYGMSVGNELLY